MCIHRERERHICVYIYIYVLGPGLYKRDGIGRITEKGCARLPDTVMKLSPWEILGIHYRGVQSEGGAADGGSIIQ